VFNDGNRPGLRFHLQLCIHISRFTKIKILLRYLCCSRWSKFTWRIYWGFNIFFSLALHVTLCRIICKLNGKRDGFPIRAHLVARSDSTDPTRSLYVHALLFFPNALAFNCFSWWLLPLFCMAMTHPFSCSMSVLVHMQTRSCLDDCFCLLNVGICYGHVFHDILTKVLYAQTTSIQLLINVSPKLWLTCSSLLAKRYSYVLMMPVGSMFDNIANCCSIYRLKH
jgi:hypothetical protein